MAAFADVSDLESRWRALTGSERARAEVLLRDAAAIIEAEGVDASGPGAAAAEMLKIVSCDMVRRAMLASPDSPPAAQGSLTVGPFSESLTYANPTGDLYLTRAERRRLGAGGGRVGSIAPACGPGALR